MLRITETDVTVDGTKLRPDGKLVGPWVREMRLVCDPILAKGQQIQIDCSGVSSLDSDGIALLQGVARRGSHPGQLLTLHKAAVGKEWGKAMKRAI